MHRLTTDTPKGGLQTVFNLFYAQDGNVMVRGGSPAPDFSDVRLFEYIRQIISVYKLPINTSDDDLLDETMWGLLTDGFETTEGIVATLYAAAYGFASLHNTLKSIEDILGDDYDLEHLREIVQAAREEPQNGSWNSAKKILPEELPENIGRKTIPCLVALESRYPNGKAIIQKRQRQWVRHEGFFAGWEWSRGASRNGTARITHWMPLPEAPKED